MFVFECWLRICLVSGIDMSVLVVMYSRYRLIVVFDMLSLFCSYGMCVI